MIIIIYVVICIISQVEPYHIIINKSNIQHTRRRCRQKDDVIDDVQNKHGAVAMIALSVGVGVSVFWGDFNQGGAHAASPFPSNGVSVVSHSTAPYRHQYHSSHPQHHQQYHHHDKHQKQVRKQQLSLIETLKNGVPASSKLLALVEVTEDTMAIMSANQPQSPQSAGWEASRAKRTAAVKDLEKKGIVRVDTDDVGNSFLVAPWMPSRRVPYKSLSVIQRLQNEVCAGAFGEFSKDVLLHAVDTAKTRRQAEKKKAASLTASLGTEGIGEGALDGAGLTLASAAAPAASASSPLSLNSLKALKDLYSGFPVVMLSSIPQGGAFFLVKKGLIELLGMSGLNSGVLSATLPIGFGTMAYWAFRTPAEVIKTQVQTGQAPNVKEAFETAKISNPKGVYGLWKHYPVMLWLDIPFQIFFFVLYGAVSEAVAGAGYAPSVLTRLFCGVTSGMASAAVTCPIDVCKTRILSRDRQQQELYLSSVRSGAGSGSSSSGSSSGGISSDSGSGSASGGGISSDGGSGSASGGGGGDSAFLSSTASEGGVAMVSPSATAGAGSGSGSGSGSGTDSGTPYTPLDSNNNVIVELAKIYKEEGVGTLFLGIRQRLLYVGLANGIRLAAYGTSRMDLMMRSLDEI